MAIPPNPSQLVKQALDNAAKLKAFSAANPQQASATGSAQILAGPVPAPPNVPAPGK